MMTFDSRIEYLPSKIYPGINFPLLKSQLRSLSDEYKDYGSLFLIEGQEFSISINHIGKIVCYYSEYDMVKFNKLISEIENIFKSHKYEITYN